MERVLWLRHHVPLWVLVPSGVMLALWQVPDGRYKPTFSPVTHKAAERAGLSPSCVSHWWLVLIARSRGGTCCLETRGLMSPYLEANVLEERPSESPYNLRISWPYTGAPSKPMTPLITTGQQSKMSLGMEWNPVEIFYDWAKLLQTPSEGTLEHLEWCSFVFFSLPLPSLNNACFLIILWECMFDFF